jgi:hypothetical protein
MVELVGKATSLRCAINPGRERTLMTSARPQRQPKNRDIRQPGADQRWSNDQTIPLGQAALARLHPGQSNNTPPKCRGRVVWIDDPLVLFDADQHGAHHAAK